VINVKDARNRRKFKNFIVNKKQLILVIIITVYFFLSVIVTLTAIIAPVYSDIFQSNDAIAQREAAKVFILLSEKLGIALSAIFLFTITPLIWGTHKFFGPLINFLKIFKRVARGDLTARVFLRRGDLLKSEARLANEIIQSLEMIISDVKQQNHLLFTTLNGIVEGRCPKSGIDNKILEAHNQARTCEALLSNLITTERSGNGQIPEKSPEISCPKSYSSKDLKDLDPPVTD
jgi:methyl-accepting chemotaxis protein